MIPDWSRATVLAAAAFEACWEVLGLGETPWQLEPPRHGLTTPARQAFVTEVAAQLGPPGRAPAWLRLLARPAWSVDVRLRADDLVAGLVAGRGPVGVLAVRHDDEIALVDIPAAAAVDAVLDLLGPVRPGPGRPTRSSSPTAHGSRGARGLPRRAHVRPARRLRAGPRRRADTPDAARDRVPPHRRGRLPQRAPRPVHRGAGTRHPRTPRGRSRRAARRRPMRGRPTAASRAGARRPGRRGRQRVVDRREDLVPLRVGDGVRGVAVLQVPVGVEVGVVPAACNCSSSRSTSRSQRLGTTL